jgi:hypothetical protein
MNILNTTFPHYTEEARRYDSELILKQLICWTLDRILFTWIEPL